MKRMLLIRLKSVAVFNVMAFNMRESLFQALPFSYNAISAVQLSFIPAESRFEMASKKPMTVCCTFCWLFVNGCCACTHVERNTTKNRKVIFFKTTGLFLAAYNKIKRPKVMQPTIGSSQKVTAFYYPASKYFKRYIMGASAP